jgi:methionyl-tRNA formyltransferase
MNCIIACQQSWCFGLAEQLHKATDHQFTEITEKSQLTLMALDKVKPDYIFFPHWSDLIPEEIHARYQCVIFHMTDLPYGRGGSPLQNLVIRGHRHTMISAIKCVQELDAGPIYLKERLSLHGSAENIFLRASGVIESMIIKILSERPKPFEQEGEITIFNRRTPEQSDWSDASTLDEVHDRIRMLDAEGYPPAFVRVGPYKLEFSRASRNVDSVVADVSIRKVEE